MTLWRIKQGMFMNVITWRNISRSIAGQLNVQSAVRFSTDPVHDIQYPAAMTVLNPCLIIDNHAWARVHVAGID